MLQGDELSQEQEGYVEKILFNTQRLSGLVGNILLLSRLENQNIPMKKTKYRLDEQIRQAFLALEDKWTEKGIGFQVEMEEVRYVGNEGLFMHIWMNLLDNAIKFSPENGTITMFLRHENDSVQFILCYENCPPPPPEPEPEDFGAKYKSVAEALDRVEKDWSGLLDAETEYYEKHLFLSERQRASMRRMLRHQKNTIDRYKNDLNEMADAYRKENQEYKVERSEDDLFSGTER